MLDLPKDPPCTPIVLTCKISMMEWMNAKTTWLGSSFDEVWLYARLGQAGFNLSKGQTITRWEPPHELYVIFEQVIPNTKGLSWPSVCQLIEAWEEQAVSQSGGR